MISRQCGDVKSSPPQRVQVVGIRRRSRNVLGAFRASACVWDLHVPSHEIGFPQHWADEIEKESGSGSSRMRSPVSSRLTVDSSKRPIVHIVDSLYPKRCDECSIGMNAAL